LQIVKYKNLRCDPYEEDRNNLIEAKCSAVREYLRMAVGQLFEYAFLGRKYFGKSNKAILLLRSPIPDLLNGLKNSRSALYGSRRTFSSTMPMGNSPEELGRAQLTEGIACDKEPSGLTKLTVSETAP
jgi:hypothetical protein